MKQLIILIALAHSIGITSAQQASDYFPEYPEVRWEYKSTVLDSLNNKIDDLYYYKHDLFVDEAAFEGKLAKIIKTKSGPEETINFQPYLDSLFYHFSGSNGFEYFKLGIIKNVIFILDSLISNSTFSIFGFFQSLEQWYSIYRFAQTVNDEYTMLQIDTSVTFGTETIPLRLEYRGERFEEDTIETILGELTCKKFARKIELNYIVHFPPLPPVPVPILLLEDYVWIAEGCWIVKGVIPSIYVDLTVLNMDPFYIPGLLTELDKIVITDVDPNEGICLANDITLFQNYPNPFNPNTKISWKAPEGSWQTLTIYDVLGNEVLTLVDEYKPAGTYGVEWNATNYQSGVYFYQLKTEKFVEIKKMILMK